MSEIDSRAARGLCCFRFLHYDRTRQDWAQKLSTTFCDAPLCEMDELLCERHYMLVSGKTKRDAARAEQTDRDQRRRYRRAYYMKRRARLRRQADDQLHA